MAERRPSLKRKILGYRSQVPRSLEEHAAHWRGFQFTAGPVRVFCYGPWGAVQVWAVSRAEGERVIRHAAAIAGADVDDPSLYEWAVSEVSSSRLGKVFTARVQERPEGTWVTAREGSSGYPLLEVPP